MGKMPFSALGWVQSPSSFRMRRPGGAQHSGARRVDSGLVLELELTDLTEGLNVASQG